MATFDARHRAISQRLAEAFDLSGPKVDEYLTREANLEEVNSFFKADGPGKLLFYFQPQEKIVNGEVDIDGPPTLLLTHGDQEKMRSKGVFFVRMNPKGISAGSVDNDMATGELLPGQPLETLQLLMQTIYKPLLETKEDWGKNSEENTKEYIGGLQRFCDSLKEAVDSLHGGVDLKKPEKKFDVENKQPAINKAANDPELVNHYEGLVDDWCKACEKLLAEPETARKEADDIGPNSELDFWRNRMAKLNSITEQLKSRECKIVLAVLGAAKSRALKKWKTVDNNITDAGNEAKDNVKYLSTLEKYTEPLYNGTPATIIDSLPGLMNNVKMMHTIARYYNTTERMTTLFVKITNQMINNCKKFINSAGRLWDQPADTLINNMEMCIKLNEAYQEQYRLTKDKLLTQPKGKQFDFSENQIFGKFELFCKRIQKLIDMFTTIHQFSALAHHNIDGMDSLIGNFFNIVEDFKKKGYELLDYQKNQFDRDYLEFNVNIHELETALQGFINSSFESITSTEHALNLLRKFQSILQRENLKSDLDSKFMVIFHNYGLDLETVQKLYEKNKHNPPFVRNAPPVAGSITWSRQLLKRIEVPMKKFQTNKNIMNTKESKKIVRTYNKVARALIEFETLWHYAWCKSIEAAKAGLQATLIIRYSKNNKLYVNFDREILQLIRETKWLQRMHIEVPESAKMVLLQEEKFKNYHNQLTYALKEYERVVGKVTTVTHPLLKPLIDDLDLKIQPGMLTLTWTSMNIDGYLHTIHSGLARFEELVSKVNDVIESRIDHNLQLIAKTVLVDLPTDQSMTLDNFVTAQEKIIKSKSTFLDAKNIEVERAVDDLLHLVFAYPLDYGLEVSAEESLRLRRWYNKLMYKVVLTAIKNSFKMIKKRVGSKVSGGFLYMERPFFEVEVNLTIPEVTMNPSLDEIQFAINRCAISVLKCTKKIRNWGLDVSKLDEEGSPLSQEDSFYNDIGRDKEIVRSILLLTGSIEGNKRTVHEYLSSFRKYNWLWQDDMAQAYSDFMKTNPSLEAFEGELLKFSNIEDEIASIPALHNIGALCLETQPLKYSLKSEAGAWKAQFAKNLHSSAKSELENIVQYMRDTTVKLSRDIVDLEDVRNVMGILKEVRERESEIDLQFGPVEEKYSLLVRYNVRVPKEELDLVQDLHFSWKKLRTLANTVNDKLNEMQPAFKRDLMKSVKIFQSDVHSFVNEYESHGPMVPGIKPADAVERLKKYQRLFEDRDRKLAVYSAGEELFGLTVTEYPELAKIRKELGLLEKLYSLYLNVISTVDGYYDILWVDVVSNIEQMTQQLNDFQNSCKRLPKSLREYDAYADLKKKIDDFLETLPLLQHLSNKAMRNRHWQRVMEATGSTFDLTPEIFKLSHLLDADLLNVKDEIEDISISAVNELNIEGKLKQIMEEWSEQVLSFANFKNRGPIILKGADIAEITEKLEESSMALGSMMASRYVAPFRENVTEWVSKLSTVGETIEQWVIVQSMWMYLEAVFCSGDIAKQLPQEARRFQNIDKSWVKIMQKAFETRNVIQSCLNEQLRQLLPHLTEQLELCQKSLSGYLEAKRNMFPRFYFVSDPVLLEILSQGSDPQAMQAHFQAVFDSLATVTFDAQEKNKIIGMQSSEGEDQPMSEGVVAVGNVEDWLVKLEKEMQTTIKDVARMCAAEVFGLPLREFTYKYPAQISLLGIQLQWTLDMQDAISKAKSDKGAMNTNAKKVTAILTELAQYTLEDLDRLDRTKIESMVTIHVHQKDVTDELVKKKLKDVNDFEWQKQGRFYWKMDVDECVISFADVDFDYCYENLGVKERLVVTPLTDRCYVTLSQALGMFLGGAPAGPAGTGKTETTKDMGRALGKFVVVFNCSDQMDVRAMAKIYKGLAMSGSWGCFDEFNRIDLDVLSVCAAQVASVLNCIKDHKDTLVFPTDGATIQVNPKCGFFITMNPGYAGRQELPENLKSLFRGVAMMVPNRQIIMKVKLASVGFLENQLLSKKFNVLYKLCEQQLSKQPHYDFGLRNILSVLRTAGAVKRSDNGQNTEILLMMRTLRDMNMSKFVAEDVPLFLSLVADLFPGLQAEKNRYPDVEKAITKSINEQELQEHKDWVNKVIQLYETSLVRHGIMVVGPAGAGKSCCIRTLSQALSEVVNPHKIIRMNPKAILASQMFGYLDPMSNDWTDGIFAALWRTCAKEKKKNMWLVLDGPVDAIWIENLNTVLDDNKLLTLANGDRIPMTGLMKIMFEPEDLRNASPATVSRAGIIFMSESELGWKPVNDSWLSQRRKDEIEPLTKLYGMTMETKEGPVLIVDALFTFLRRECKEKMSVPRVNQVATSQCILEGLLGELSAAGETPVMEHMERLFVYALTWSVGSLLEPEDRIKFSQKLNDLLPALMPKMGPKDIIYDYYVDEGGSWQHWQSRVPEWDFPQGDFEFSTIFVPTLDSTRSDYAMSIVANQFKNVLLIGDTGTSKTSIVLQFLLKQGENVATKKLSFSSATSPMILQRILENCVEKRQGKTFGPPGGKKMYVFIDDQSMPNINEWGDQITSEILRQTIEDEGFYSLEKPGDFKNLIDLTFIGAMQHPGGGKNDIPNRLKRHYMVLNVPLPSVVSIDQIFGAMVRGRFVPLEDDVGFPDDVVKIAHEVTEATITIWEKVKAKMLPTPAKFHYLFNMRDLSRVFQVLLQTPQETIKTPLLVVQLWRHECERVFADRLIDNSDKDWFDDLIVNYIGERWGGDMKARAAEKIYFVDFLREPIYDEETGEEVAAAPKIYEPIISFDDLRERLKTFEGGFNEVNKTKRMDLVYFEDAMKHLMRLCRVLMTPRGSILLVGVGGSGKQSLTRLAAFICDHWCFQITITKAYNTQSLFDDLKAMYKHAGHLGKGVTFLFTDNEVKEESYLEYINQVLGSGEVANLLQKDEIDGIVGDLMETAKKLKPDLELTYDNIYKWFIDRVRDNLHIVLCMSPVGEKFRQRARMFPGLIAGCTIDWFLPWPTDALVEVSTKYIGEFNIENDAEVKQGLIRHMAKVHRIVAEATAEYFDKFRRKVYVTPKSYLSFLTQYKEVYHSKCSFVQSLANKINTGLQKLMQAEDDVAEMKVQLADKEVNLQEAQKSLAVLLQDISSSTAKAEKKKSEVETVKASLQVEADKIGAEKEAAERDLEAAKPALLEAENALKAITPKDIQTLKQLRNPPDIVKRIFDLVLILRMKKLVPVSMTIVKDQKQIQDSYGEASIMMNDMGFLDALQKFPKEEINDETCELMMPYLQMADFSVENAKKASGNVAGLAIWAKSMKTYHECAKIVAPKLEQLRVAEGNLNIAMKKLNAAVEELNEVQSGLDALKEKYDSAMAEKEKLQEDADSTKRKMDAANALIDGLSGEKTRWIEQSKSFADEIRRLVGDVAVACAFVSYCGPFNQEFRTLLINNRFMGDLNENATPYTQDINIIKFLVDESTIGEWNLQGLPTDPLSVQNGILTTRSARWPLMIDPQGQGNAWIKSREEQNQLRVATITHKNFRQNLEDCMAYGRPLLIENIEEEMDPSLDPVLNKNIIIKGKSAIIVLSDKECDYQMDFKLYITTRLPNPHYSPELSASTTMIDFTVTMKGLEDQLLGRLMSMEKPELEAQAQKLLEDVNSNMKKIKQLEDDLLYRLSSSSGNLLDDVTLIDVLAVTKKTSKEVQEKLATGAETEKKIKSAREEFRPVATRGSVLYFLIAEMAMVNVMYQVALKQFLGIFDTSVNESEKAAIASKRIVNISEHLTYAVQLYMTRGVFERHKIMFTILLGIKIQLQNGSLSHAEFQTLLKGGSALDIKSARPKPFNWIPDMAWLNLVQMGQSVPIFEGICDAVQRNEAMWKAWYDLEEPENAKIPDYEDRLNTYQKMMVVRSLREDRTLLAATDYIMDSLGKKFADSVPLNLENVWMESNCRCPVICILSMGSDPTALIEGLAKKKKKDIKSVSMGRGQEVYARRFMHAGVSQGSWVLLQNCHLSLKFLAELETFLLTCEDIHEEFRMWITAEPHPKFPIGLLQMSLKITNEAPAGIRAGMKRSYNWVTQDMIDAINKKEWRSLLYTVCFMHSVIQERRKFGPIGFCIPYEFNQSDLSACVTFLQSHLIEAESKKGGMSWTTIKYMICEVQYGGRITDDYDRRLFNTYGDFFLAPKIFDSSFKFYPGYTIPLDIDRNKILAHIEALPLNDNPEIFGLHSNADLVYRMKQSRETTGTILDIQPKESGGGGGMSREDYVDQLAQDLLGKLPKDFKMDDVKEKIRKQGGQKPLNIFLKQEVDRLQTVITIVRKTLSDLRLAIAGTIILSAQLQDSLNALYDAKVPASWVKVSWISPTFGLWFSALLERNNQLTTWLDKGRPKSFWLTGFFNPQGFTTSMQQEITRKHSGWALDEVVLHSEVAKYEKEEVRESPDEGVYIHGLWLEGAAWDKKAMKLVDSQPKVLHTQLPCLYVSAVQASDKKVDMYAYSCPVYIYPIRNDRFLVFAAELRSEDPPTKWILRAVTLLCQKD